MTLFWFAVVWGIPCKFTPNESKCWRVRPATSSSSWRWLLPSLRLRADVTDWVCTSYGFMISSLNYMRQPKPADQRKPTFKIMTVELLGELGRFLDIKQYLKFQSAWMNLFIESSFSSNVFVNNFADTRTIQYQWSQQVQAWVITWQDGCHDNKKCVMRAASHEWWCIFSFDKKIQYVPLCFFFFSFFKFDQKRTIL